MVQVGHSVFLIIDGWQWSRLGSIAQDRILRTYNGEDEMTKKTKNASPL
ncbi:hypothetical protein [Limnospira fusiformis]|nr:hypothetical protein HFV01_07675 [Limnospira fusiformis SAG 85.79]